MKGLRCLLGFHDFFAQYPPLILAQKEKTTSPCQYVIVKRICIRPNCKKKEEFIVQLSEKLQDWDVTLAAPNFKSEEWHEPTDA